VDKTHIPYFYGEISLTSFGLPPTFALKFVDFFTMEAHRVKSARNGERGMKQRILIADDDEKVLTLLSSSLKKAGYDTSQALNGISALELIKNEKPDLILADVAMPEMDGFELCKLIRDNPETANIPFIFLTAKGELQDRVTGLTLGADDYISKPFHISEVTARIKAILQRMSYTHSSASAEESETDLKGNLQQLNLGEVLQTLQMTQKTGGLKITNSNKIGKIYFDHGTIVQAILDKYKREEALYRILAWEEGLFEFDSNDRAETHAITTPINRLLMEGFEQRTEYLRYKEAMPSFERILKISDLEKTDEAKPASQKVLVLINGQRTIQDVINVSPMNYLATTKILYTFLKKGMVEIVEILPDQEGQRDYGQLAQELYE
jgi:DNA-binding response OmpR family regulator